MILLNWFSQQDANSFDRRRFLINLRLIQITARSLPSPFWTMQERREAKETRIHWGTCICHKKSKWPIKTTTKYFYPCYNLQVPQGIVGTQSQRKGAVHHKNGRCHGTSKSTWSGAVVSKLTSSIDGLLSCSTQELKTSSLHYPRFHMPPLPHLREREDECTQNSSPQGIFCWL